MKTVKSDYKLNEEGAISRDGINLALFDMTDKRDGIKSKSEGQGKGGEQMKLGR